MRSFLERSVVQVAHQIRVSNISLQLYNIKKKRSLILDVTAITLRLNESYRMDQLSDLSIKQKDILFFFCIQFSDASTR